MKNSRSNLGSLVSALAMALVTVPAAPVAFAADAPAKTAAPCAGGNPCAGAKRRRSGGDNPCAGNPCAGSRKRAAGDDANPCAGAKRRSRSDNPCAGKSR